MSRSCLTYTESAKACSSSPAFSTVYCYSICTLFCLQSKYLGSLASWLSLCQSLQWQSTPVSIWQGRTIWHRGQSIACATTADGMCSMNVVNFYASQMFVHVQECLRG